MKHPRRHLNFFKKWSSKNLHTVYPYIKSTNEEDQIRAAHFRRRRASIVVSLPRIHRSRSSVAGARCGRFLSFSLRVHRFVTFGREIRRPRRRRIVKFFQRATVGRRTKKTDQRTTKTTAARVSSRVVSYDDERIVLWFRLKDHGDGSRGERAEDVGRSGGARPSQARRRGG